MKKITLTVLAAVSAVVMSSCCCQEVGPPTLSKTPKFNDLNQPECVAPTVFKCKK